MRGWAVPIACLSAGCSQVGCNQLNGHSSFGSGWTGGFLQERVLELPLSKRERS